MCSGSEAGSYSRLIDFVYHSTLGVRVIKKKKKEYRDASTKLKGATKSGSGGGSVSSSIQCVVEASSVSRTLQVCRKRFKFVEEVCRGSLWFVQEA